MAYEADNRPNERNRRYLLNGLFQSLIPPRRVRSFPDFFWSLWAAHETGVMAYEADNRPNERNRRCLLNGLFQSRRAAKLFCAFDKNGLWDGFDIKIYTGVVLCKKNPSRARRLKNRLNRRLEIR
jgi:hypothetical protein